jgi:hypothetical protein
MAVVHPLLLHGQAIRIAGESATREAGRSQRRWAVRKETALVFSRVRRLGRMYIRKSLWTLHSRSRVFVMSFSKEWVEFLLPMIIFVALFLLRYVSQFVRAKRLKEIAPFVNGEAVIWPFSPPRIKGMYMGIPYQMIFLPSGRNSPGRMQIKISFPFPFGLEVRRRARTQGLEQLFQRGKRIETGDETFDASVEARAEKEREKAELYLDNPVNRKMILNVLQDGFDGVRYTEKELVLTRQGDFLKGDLNAERALHDLSLAAVLMQRL